MSRALHRRPQILVLPNAWDCASARIVEEAGFPAIATTSAGVANALGYSDGERIPAAEMLAAATAAGLVASGAIGLNLEDAGDAPGHLLDETGRQLE